jgi:hypothetical protein
MKIKQNIQDGLGCNPSIGPIFGVGNDFIIFSDSNTNIDSYSELGYTYEHPNYHFKSNEARSFLSGSFKFSTSEIEVFQVLCYKLKKRIFKS